MVQPMFPHQRVIDIVRQAGDQSISEWHRRNFGQRDVRRLDRVSQHGNVQIQGWTRRIDGRLTDRQQVANFAK